MPSCSLKDFCFSKNAEKNSDFVGIHFKDGKFRIIFPIGFAPSLNDEALLRKEILLLISILRKFRPEDKSNKNSEFKKNDLQSFPISSYLFIFRYFMKNGYYRTKEEFYKKSTSGKISWKMTIKQVRPVLNGENVSYLEFITKKPNYNDDELVSIINKFCVYESFEKIGCLFTSFRPKNPHIRCQKKLFSSFLKRKISETFNDDDRELFKNMLAVIQGNDSDGRKCEYFYGTDEFHNVWEKLVDSAFGNVEKDSDIQPHFYWHITERPLKITLIPDTIMFNKGENKIYILDAKYYRAGNDLYSGSLPSAESVPKQLVYAERIKTKKIVSPENIYNAFILPFESKSQTKIEYFGFVEPDWIDSKIIEKYPYYKIQGIRIDTRFLMQNHFKDDKTIKNLVNIIENRE